jgi:hypothetical protein
MERTVREDHDAKAARSCDCIPQKEVANSAFREVERLVAGGGSEVGERKVGTKRSAVHMITNPVTIHRPSLAVDDGVAF